MIRTLTPSRLRRSSSLPHAGEGGTRRAGDGRMRVRKFGKRVGAVVVALVALDLIATAAAVALGASWVAR